MDKVTEGEKYQGGGQENREGTGSLRTSHSPTETNWNLGLFAGCWAGLSRCPVKDFGSY